jgi:ribonuclease-3
MERTVEKKITEFQELINYEFKYQNHLVQALTTPRYGNENQVPHYEILEILGDSLIKLILSLKLYERGETDPGNLTQIKLRLEDNRTLIEIGREISLKNYIISSQENIEDTKILADVFEAVCGAVYLDSGKDLKIVEEKIIDRFLIDKLRFIEESPHLYKNQLLEFLQEIVKFTPKILFEYDKFGPDNDLRWRAKNPQILDNNGNIIFELPNDLKSKKFKSKKEAEKDLSLTILNYLKNEELNL